MRFRIKLGRRKTLQVEPYTGRLLCGCRLFYGDLIERCPNHVVGRHRAPEDQQTVEEEAE